MQLLGEDHVFWINQNLDFLRAFNVELATSDREVCDDLMYILGVSLEPAGCADLALGFW